MVQKVQNTLFSQNMKEICEKMVENLKTIDTASPQNVFDQLDSLELHLRIPYNFKDFYIGVGQELVKYVTDHSTGPQYHQVHNNITVISSLLEKVNNDLVECVLRQEGEEITEIAELQADVLFLLVGKSAVKICKVVAVVEETTTRSGPQKALKVAGWNDEAREWTTDPKAQHVLQIMLDGKQCLVYASCGSLRLLRLTEDQMALVNDELQKFEMPAGEMNPKIRQRLIEAGETYDKTHVDH